VHSGGVGWIKDYAYVHRDLVGALVAQGHHRQRVAHEHNVHTGPVRHEPAGIVVCCDHRDGRATRIHVLDVEDRHLASP